MKNKTKAEILTEVSNYFVSDLIKHDPFDDKLFTLSEALEALQMFGEQCYYEGRKSEFGYLMQPVGGKELTPVRTYEQYLKELEEQK